MTPWRWGALVLLAAAAPGCRAPSPVGSDDAASVRAIEAAMVRYDSLVRRMAGDSIAELFTPDGEMLGTNLAAVRGREAIRRFLASFTGIRVDSAAMRSDTVIVAGAEAAQWGTYTQTATPDRGATVHVQGRFVAQWRRAADGAWRMRRLMTQPAPISPPPGP